MKAVTPFLIEGDLGIDDRGEISFANKLNFAHEGIRRFYLVSNHQSNFVRAWHAHKKEAKYVMAVSGSAVVAAVRVVNWKRPRLDVPVHRYILSASKPSVLFIPAGYANGWMSLTPHTKLVFFSTATIEESKSDDVRFPATYWNPWKVEQR